MAAARLRQLVDELRILTSAFPDLRDSFDPDELPIEYILKRDAHSEPSSTPNPAAPRLTAARRRTSTGAARRHAGRKQPGSDE